MTQINHPEYYNSGGIEAADFIDAHGLNFNRGNIVKYVVRAGKKDGEDALTALLKAQWYLNREIIRTGKEQEIAEQMPEGVRLLVFDPQHYPEDNDHDFRPNNHNLYFLFGLHADATQDDIKAAYRKLTRKYHPDLHHGDTRFQNAYAVINNIYSILSNIRKRAEYNFHYRRHIMLWGNKYNPNDYNEDKYSLIPEGDYRVRIENAEEATSHANNNMIKLTLAISGYSSKLWYYLVLNDNSPEEIKKTNKKLGKIFESFGIAEGDFSLDKVVF